MKQALYISGLEEESIVDGPGVRFVVFTQGCTHNCPGCHNPATHALDSGGTLMPIDEIFDRIARNPIVSGVTFSGGDPMLQSEACASLATRCRYELGLGIWTYTGFVWEAVSHYALSKASDVVVDGPFVEALKSYELLFRGSANQRLIDVGKTLKTGAVCVLPD